MTSLKDRAKALTNDLLLKKVTQETDKFTFMKKRKNDNWKTR